MRHTDGQPLAGCPSAGVVGRRVGRVLRCGLGGLLCTLAAMLAAGCVVGTPPALAASQVTIANPDWTPVPTATSAFTWPTRPGQFPCAWCYWNMWPNWD
jgi:hypothetical protein